VLAWALAVLVKYSNRNAEKGTIGAKARDLFYLNIPYTVFLVTLNEFLVQSFL